MKAIACVLLTWLVVLVVGAATARAQYTTNLTVASVTAGGTTYNWTAVHVAVWWTPGNPGYGLNPYSGLTGEYIAPGVSPVILWSNIGAVSDKLGDFSQSGTLFVPAGVTYVFRKYYREYPGASWYYIDVNAGGGAGAGGKKISVSYFNDKPYSVRIKLVKDGSQVMGTYTVGANTLFGQTLENLPDGSYELLVEGEGFGFTDGQWIVAPGAIHVASTTTVPSEKVLPPGTAVTPANTVVVPTATNLPANLPTGQAGGGTVWTATGPSAATDLLTNKVYREGIDKVTARLDAADRVAKRVESLEKASPTQAAQDAAGVAAKASTESAFGSVVAPTGKGYSLSPSGAPSLSVSMPAKFGGATFDLNPFQSDRFQAVCAWFRAACEWLAIALLAGFVFKEWAQWVRGLAGAQQAKGNTIAAGTGAQATALVAAGLMTAAVIAGITAILAWSFDSINFAALVASATVNPVATMPTGALWMLDQVLPISVLITCLVARSTFNLYASAVFAGTAALVRFIVP